MEFYDPKIAVSDLDLQTWHSKHEKEVTEGILSDWRDRGSRYYKMFPMLLRSASRVPIDDLSKYPEFNRDVICVRMAKGNSIARGEWEMSSVMAATARRKAGVAVMGLIGEATKKGTETSVFFTAIVDWSESLERYIGEAKSRLVEMRNNDMESFNTACWVIDSGFQVALFALLLKDNPELCTPEVLSRDFPKWEHANEAERKVMVDRAVRRGKHGFTLGREYETIPHFRRPHLALRHTGKGGAIPKIVQVRHSIVKREVAARVPTGSYAEDQEVDDRQAAK